MPKPFDVSTKELVEFSPPDWLRAGLPSEAAEGMDADLATVSTEADRVVHVTAPDEYLAHFEFQSSFDASLLSRTLRYNVLLDVKYGLPVQSVLILLRPDAETPGMSGTLTRQNTSGQTYLTFNYQVVRLWEFLPKRCYREDLEPCRLRLSGRLRRKSCPMLSRK